MIGNQPVIAEYAPLPGKKPGWPVQWRFFWRLKMNE